MPFPSEEQAQVIEHKGAPLIVVAGPGTGKTRTLVERMIKLLREDHSREVSFVTFTRTSMRDTERKLVRALGEGVLDDAQFDFPRVSTLHTYAKRLVHRYGDSIGVDPSFSILIDSRGERVLVVAEVLQDVGLDISVDDLSEAISKVRASQEWPDQFPASDSEKLSIIDRFNILLELYKTLDMEGVLLAACEILRAADAHLPEVYLQVDEYQDLNPVDQEFISVLSSNPASQIVVVGDDAQSIYGFRHANLDGLRALWHSDEWEGICFPDSFRLESHILNAALDLLGQAQYIGARINRKPPNGKKMPVLQCTTPDIQIEAIARHIHYRLQRAQEDPDTILNLRDFLILCPTKTQVKQVVRMLNNEYDLPSHSGLKPSIADEYWNLILVLRMASTSDPLALRQWLPLIGYSQKEITRLRVRAIDDEVGFFKFVTSIEDERISQLLSSLESIRAEPRSRTQLLDELESVVPLTIPDDFSHLLGSWENDDEGLPSLGTLIQLVYEHVGILHGREEVSEDDRILVGTMHTAKGLEASFVYCAWMNSTFMPLANKDPDEQKRILYVVLTRAKNDVVMTFPERFDSARNRRLGREELSPFIEEIFDHVHLFRVTASSIRRGQLPWQP